MMTIPDKMSAVLLTGHGGIEKLEYRTDVPVPQPGRGEVLIRVAAAGVNNTDINTRIGWYSKAVIEDTNAGGAEGFASVDKDDASWSGIPLSFPRIQGADACGYIVATGEDVDQARIGERVIVQTILRSLHDFRPYECATFGSECDGGFAQFALAPAIETHAIKSNLSDVELAAMPCAFSTAEGMMHRANIGAERVMITGASGGVGSAAIQLAKRRGATVVAICSAAKSAEVKAIGADEVVDRNADLLKELGEGSMDVVVDLVAGEQWPTFLDLLRRGGKYVTAGAIAGPIAQIDVRTLYLKDLTLYGCTFQDEAVFKNLVSYIEAGEIRPVVAGTYPLADIAIAQADFLSKKHTGKLVLIPEKIEE